MGRIRWIGGMKSRVYNSKTETWAASRKRRAAAGMKTHMEHIQFEYSLSQYFTAYTKSNCEHFKI
jgi:hypothetical protein